MEGKRNYLGYNEQNFGRRRNKSTGRYISIRIQKSNQKENKKSECVKDFSE